VKDSDIDPDLLERWAFDYLARYASSAENLRRVLMRRVRRRAPDAVPVAAPLIEALLMRFSESGLLDDVAYAVARAEALHRRGESLRAMRARLSAKGVQSSVVEEVVSALISTSPEPDLAAACAFARRRRLGPFRRSAADHTRELRAFARAGFSRRIAKAVLACADVAAVEALAHGELG
jgi:regulatory protein